MNINSRRQDSLKYMDKERAGVFPVVLSPRARPISGYLNQ